MKKNISPKANSKFIQKESKKSDCKNAECKLRKRGCLGFEGCPGFKK